jgi:hypothetical protein
MNVIPEKHTKLYIYIYMYISGCGLDYQICVDKPSEDIHIVDLCAVWYIFLISSSVDTTVCQ